MARFLHGESGKPHTSLVAATGAVHLGTYRVVRLARLRDARLEHSATRTRAYEREWQGVFQWSLHRH